MSVLVDPGARGRTGLVTVRRRWAVCSAVMLLGAGVVACSGDGGAAATASASGAGAPTSAPASASSTPSPSPTASALPSLSPELQALRDEAMAEPKPGPYVGMDEFTAEGAKLSAVYFMDLYRYAFITGDVADIEAMHEDGCIFCDSVISDAVILPASGGWMTPWDETSMVLYVGE